MIADHRLATTPCGAGSPFARLLEEKGKILFLGAAFDAMTFFHHLEERFEGRIVPSPFTAEYFEVPVKNGAETVMVKTRLYDPAVSRRRCILPLLPELQRTGGCSAGKIGVLQLLLADAEGACSAFERMLDNGTSFYP